MRNIFGTPWWIVPICCRVQDVIGVNILKSVAFQTRRNWFEEGRSSVYRSREEEVCLDKPALVAGGLRQSFGDKSLFQS